MGDKNVRLFNLRVLSGHDAAHSIYVAQCLETGSVVTGDDKETLTDMMKELLEDEVSYAIKNGNYKNLFSSPAPPGVWRRWTELAREFGSQNVELNVNAQEIRLDEPEFYGEVFDKELASTA